MTGSGTGDEPGGSVQIALSLPAGRWELSLQYTSAENLTVSANGEHWTMPAYQDRPGPVFKVGAVTSTGRTVMVSIPRNRPSSLTGSAQAASLSLPIATRIPDTRRLIPLRHSCGRYIDWYRVEGPIRKER